MYALEAVLRFQRIAIYGYKARELAQSKESESAKVITCNLATRAALHISESVWITRKLSDSLG